MSNFGIHYWTFEICHRGVFDQGISILMSELNKEAVRDGDESN
jgi:hypothetical protein